MSFTYDYDFGALTPITGTELQSQFDKIKDKFNANIDNSDIAADAAIAATKLGSISTDVYYEVNLSVPGVAGGLLDDGDNGGPQQDGFYGTWHLEDDGNSTITDITWVCDETGAGTGTFDLQWGYFKSSSTAGDWSGSNVNSVSITLAELGTSGYGHGDVTMSGGEYALTAPTRTGFLRMLCTTSDATALVAKSMLTFTVRIKRTFTS